MARVEHLRVVSLRSSIRHSLPSRLLRKGFIAATVLGATGALAYGGMLAYLYASQEQLLFRATPLPSDYQFRFTQPFEEIRVPVAGAVLDALYFPQQDSRGLVFFLHGNAGNVETWTTGLDFHKRVGYDLFMLDYRGYGKSTGGVRSEAELHDDVRAAWEAIAPRYRGKPIVIYEPFARNRARGGAGARRQSRTADPGVALREPHRGGEARVSAGA